MKKTHYFIFCLLTILFFTSFKKNNRAATANKESLSLPATKEISIILPANNLVDLEGCHVLSLSVESGVDKKGRCIAAFNTGSTAIAYLFDKNNNVVMAGFLTDSTNTLSVSTTADVLIYTSIGKVFQANEIMEKFITGINNFPGMAEWKTELEALFIQDPLMLQKGLFERSLQNKVAEIIKARNFLKINTIDNGRPMSVISFPVYKNITNLILQA